MRLAACFVLVLSAAAQPPQQQALLGDFRLENGETIRDCRIGYRTFGTLNASKSNAILFPTWFTGSSRQIADNLGPGKLVDPSRWYVIAVDVIGNGVSSSPSNSTLQPRMRFPRFTIRDMVNSQHQLLTRVLGIQHVHAVMGISMGGMQTFEWMVAYPDFMDRAVPVVGTPTQTTYDLLLWDTERRAIQQDPAWNKGDYTSRPVDGMRTVAGIHALAISTPERRNRETPHAAWPSYQADLEKSAREGFDANNWIRQLEAMMSHDVAKPYGGDMARAAARVRAKVLMVVGLLDHMVNPQPALEFARLVKADTLELDSECGHGAAGCEMARVSPRIARFLSESAAPRPAARPRSTKRPAKAATAR